jgi:histidyl-tRNA synthetase
MDLSLPRGIRDIEPEEFSLHEKVRSAFMEVADVYDFKIMEPAPIESLPVLSAKSGVEIDEGIYSFKDKGGRDIGLRFDLTVGLTRYVVSRKGIKPPIKLASYGSAWRYEEPQHARYRWFHQWDVEIFGEPGEEADAEVIDFSYNLFKKLDLKNIIVRIGDRRVVEEFIRKSLQIESEAKVTETLRALDKVSKKTERELIQEYQKKGVPTEKIQRLLDFGRLHGDPGEVLSRLSELKLESISGLTELRDFLAQRKIAVEYDLSIVRGIDYYTSVVFEISDSEHADLGSLCGGGRYDLLPRLFGRPDLPATGAAGGIERIVASISKKGERSKTSAFVAFTDRELYHEAVSVLSKLRIAGVRSDVGKLGRGLGRQLEDSAARGFEWTLIIGKKEHAERLVVLKRMAERTEEKLGIEKAIQKIKGDV